MTSEAGGRASSRASTVAGTPLRRRTSRDGGGSGIQRTGEIGNDVVRMLDADGQPYVARRDAGGELVLGRQLRMGRGGGMDRQRARVADVGDVVEQLQDIDEGTAGRRPAGKLKADQGAEALPEIGLRPAPGF